MTRNITITKVSRDTSSEKHQMLQNIMAIHPWNILHPGPKSWTEQRCHPERFISSMAQNFKTSWKNKPKFHWFYSVLWKQTLSCLTTRCSFLLQNSLHQNVIFYHTLYPMMWQADSWAASWSHFNTKLECAPNIHASVDSPEYKRWLRLQRRAYAAKGPVKWHKKGLWMWSQWHR